MEKRIRDASITSLPPTFDPLQVPAIDSHGASPALLEGLKKVNEEEKQIEEQRDRVRLDLQKMEKELEEKRKLANQKLLQEKEDQAKIYRC